MVKRLLYVSAAILCLALTYQLGATHAQARTGTNPVVSVAFQGANTFAAMTSVGDMYRSDDFGASWRFTGNVFGATTPTGP